MKCRHCGLELSKVFLDLGYAPPSNAYLSDTQLKAAEVHYPLRLLVCTGCWLVQTEDYASADTFFSPDYAYFSSTSKSWLAHAAAYVDMITDRLGLDRQSFVVEIASNDGYLLRNFVASGVPCLGIEPTHSTAAAAEAWASRSGVNSSERISGGNWPGTASAPIWSAATMSTPMCPTSTTSPAASPRF
jgi:hypothetical protein